MQLLRVPEGWDGRGTTVLQVSSDDGNALSFQTSCSETQSVTAASGNKGPQMATSSSG